MRTQVELEGGEAEKLIPYLREYLGTSLYSTSYCRQYEVRSNGSLSTPSKHHRLTHPTSKFIAHALSLAPLPPPTTNELP